jgi:hypothetical protein
MIRLSDAEVTALQSCATRGDIMPILFWITQATFDGRLADVGRIVREVGPLCSRDALHRACALMPRAPEPRLLRAAAILSDIRFGCPACPELAWRDLVLVSCVMPNDPTVTELFADLDALRRVAA